MKQINKIFGLGLVALSTSPILVGLTNSNVNTTNILSTKKVDKNNDESKMKCTITYVGKKCAADGKTIIARCTDSNPKGSNSKLVKYKHNQRANETLKGYYGFEYKLPSETYAYISAPDGSKTNVKDDEYLFENFGINEMGVGTSCTLTCYTNLDAQDADPFVESGLGEEMLTQVITPQASSARQAMEIAAKVFDTQGSNDANIIMAVDQKEAWLMEIYTGHQYCAIKLPEDKVCVAGNEFILNSLAELGINESNKDEMCILSPGLLSLPKEKGFAVYDSTGIEDLYHLHLFNTYARALGTRDRGIETSNTDGCHMRTWRGYSLFAPTTQIAQNYIFDQKYAPFFVPTDDKGNIRNDLTYADVVNVYRDQFDDVIDKPGFERFKKAKENNTLRCIATETTRSIHIITSDPDLPKEIACNGWYCPSSANYSPFVLLNSGIESIDGEYGYCPDRFEYSDSCSSTLYRRLNALAWGDRTNYGLPLHQFWATYEYIYGTQMKQVIADASKLSVSDAKNIITNFNKHVRDIHVEAVKNATQDLTFHIMNDDNNTTKAHTVFRPLVELESYLSNLGWKDFKKDGNKVTFKYKDETATLDIGDGYYKEKGNITIGNKIDNISVEYRNNKVFVDFYKLNEVIGDRASINNINIYDYLHKFNHWVWIGPTIAAVVLGAGLATFFIIRSKKKHSKHSKK